MRWFPVIILMTPSSKWRKNYRCYGRLAEKCSSLKNARIRSFLNILFSQNGWSYVLQDILILLKENSYFYGKILATKYLACDWKGPFSSSFFKETQNLVLKLQPQLTKLLIWVCPHYTFKHVQKRLQQLQRTKVAWMQGSESNLIRTVVKKIVLWKFKKMHTVWSP